MSVFLYTSNEQFQYYKTITFTALNIILGNLISARLVHWKLLNIAERNRKSLYKETFPIHRLENTIY